MSDKTLDVGMLRHVVKIQQRVEMQDTAGDIIYVWEDVWPKVFAAIEPLSAREFMAAASLSSQITTRITIHYRAGVLPKMRIVHGSKLYNIEGVLPDANSGLEYLTLPCSTGVNEG